MYKNALGAEVKEVKVMPNGSEIVTTRQLQSNQAAAQFFLKNRNPAKWRDKQEVEHSGGVKIYDVEPMK